MAIETIIIDDEEKGRKVLLAMLAEWSNEIEVVGTAHSVKSGIELIREAKPALVLLDIELVDGYGFNILEQVRALSFDVIFITGFDHYAIQAIKFSAVDYLLKPIDPLELASALKKVQAASKEKKADFSNQLDVLLSNIHSKNNPKLAITGKDSIRFVPINDIVYCESDGSYSHFYLTGGKKVTSTRLLKDFNKLLEGSGFFRIHHQYLINLSHIEEYIRGDGGTVVLDNQIRLEVSRRKKAAFIKVLGQI